MEDISLALQKKGASDPKYANKVQEALLHVQSPSLLGGSPICFLDGTDDLSDTELDLLTHYVARPTSFSYLILGASSLKPLANLYDKGKKEIVIFDFSAEKPWQREKRMKKTVAAKFFKEGKTISPALIDLFFEGLPLEAGILEQEVIKLICYVGERKEIKLEDIQAISATCKTKEGWQIADDLVWSGKLLKIDEEVELFALIGQIRFYLEQGKSLQDISDGYPDISNSVLQKFSAKPKKTTFFTKGLILLFEFELAAKNSGGDIRILFDIFSGKLHAAAAA
jgi:DNA polymerase-3 subunit delta